MIRVVIADDHVLLLDGLAQTLGALPDIAVVGTAPDGRRLLELVGETSPHVVIADIDMPGMSGLEALEAMGRHAPPTIIVSMHTDPAYRRRASDAGAVGFLSKSTPLPHLSAAVRAAADGAGFVDADRLGELLERYALPKLDPGAAALTRRERELLSLLAAGVTTTEDLAARLFISHKTVKNHLASIYEKLGVADRAQAALEAIRLGLNGSTGP